MELSGVLEGELVIDVGGVETAVSIHQTQTTTSRMSEKRP
jgi:hypothetical protein